MLLSSGYSSSWSKSIVIEVDGSISDKYVDGVETKMFLVHRWMAIRTSLVTHPVQSNQLKNASDSPYLTYGDNIDIMEDEWQASSLGR
jgi:hypothetical protein